MENRCKKLLLENLKKFFKFESFKSDYQCYATTCVAIHMLTKSTDILINLPPASGKSICFQLPTMMNPCRITMVIVPDENTAKEQISFLTEHKIKVLQALPNTHQLNIPTSIKELLRFIYVTANMLTTDYFQTVIKEMNTLNIIGSVVIDDAHCVSEHYENLISSYREIYKLRDVVVDIPFIALTSIGTDKIMMDIKNYLHLKDPQEITHMHWKFPNVYLQVRFKDILSNPLNDMKILIKNLMETSEAFSGIIFCLNCEKAIEVAQQLTQLGISTAAYCSELEEHQRAQNEQDWVTGKITMLAVTHKSAMKLSESSVRCIIHWTIPLKLEQYYQLIGKYAKYNKPIHCRLYFSVFDWMNFQTNAVEMPSSKCEESIKMIEYCISTKCRHMIQSNYFGTKINSCGNACDSCEKGPSVRLQQQFFRELFEHNFFTESQHSRAPKIDEIDHTNNKVKNLTCLQRYDYYKNLDKALWKNYENSHGVNKSDIKTRDLRYLARGLEYSILSVSHKQQDYCCRMVELITKIENSTKSNELTNYIINYKYIISIV